MTLDAISIWLKSTIPGIILLGAFGSIFAAIIIWFSHRFIFPRFTKALVQLIAKVAVKFAGPATEKMAKFILKNGQDKLPLYYTFQTMKLALALFVSTCCFILFAMALNNSNQNFAQSSVLIPIVLSFLGVWNALESVANVMIPMYFDIQKLVEEAKKDFIVNRSPKNVD